MILDTLLFEYLLNKLFNFSFENGLWIVIFNATSAENVKQPIKEYFTNFLYLSQKSTVYSLVITNPNLLLFEVYRMTSLSELTITLLCQLESQSQRVEFLDKKPVYERRKNLTGVHLQIGVLMKSIFISSDNEVQFLFSLSLKNIPILNQLFLNCTSEWYWSFLTPSIYWFVPDQKLCFIYNSASNLKTKFTQLKMIKSEFSIFSCVSLNLFLVIYHK